MILDGVAGPDYELIGHLTFSGDSRRFAYAAQKEGKRFIVLDGVPGPPFEDVFISGFSPDHRHLVYYSTEKKKRGCSSTVGRVPNLIRSVRSGFISKEKRPRTDFLFGITRGGDHSGDTRTRLRFCRGRCENEAGRRHRSLPLPCPTLSVRLVSGRDLCNNARP